MPWIPREYMEPMEDPQLAVGRVESYDEYLETTTDTRNKIDTWTKYFQYAKEMYEYVTRGSFDANYLKCENMNEKIEFDGKFYLILDTTVNASWHILQLYNDLLNNKENRLYSKLTDGEIETPKPLIKNCIRKMKEHVGQMGGEYSLSPSQREALNHFGETEEGDILAVSGPPGTGKTTLLQSIVANMYVEAALEEKNPSIIVAASNNNQAVTNIIDSFGKINQIGLSNLEKKWITGSNSFAIYFPSSSKIKEAKKNKYQYTTVNGGAFFDDIEAEENREKARTFFLKEFAEYFGGHITDFSDCKRKLANELHELDKQRRKILSLIDKIKKIIGQDSYGKYENDLMELINRLEEERQTITHRIQETKEFNQKYVRRCTEWRTSYDSLPWYVRLFRFLPVFKNRLTAWSFSFMQDDEISFLKRDMKIDEIERIYQKKIINNDEIIMQLGKEEEEKKNEIELPKKKLSEIRDRMNTLKSEYKFLGRYQVCNSDGKMEELWRKFEPDKLNDLLDKVRYVEFWLAVHYFECRWILEDNPISEKQRGKTYENILDTMYHRLAMIAPCMVMTFFMLPKQFYAYNNENDKKHHYMYNYIDLLVVDEAGQISPEMAAPSFALAKKAIVVGDEKQIPPVWGTTKALDIAMAISCNVIKDVTEYEKIVSNGLNCAQSSIMKIASLSCAYNKYEKGLFLCEHRRCYNEIIEYCNKLVYNGKLDALRGSFITDKKNSILGVLPAMGHKQICSSKSQKSGNSRKNNNEAEQIIFWIQKNYNILMQKYKNVDQKEILGIITPFKSQSMLIKSLLKKNLPEYAASISVGTVHTFQGAERKVIIFSSVYGSEDGCFFINKAPNIMNVAVSRAKDSFLVFGDSNCLTGGEKSAAGLLKKMTFTSIE